MRAICGVEKYGKLTWHSSLDRRMLHRKSLLCLFFSSPSCHSALHCSFLSIVSLPILILILQLEAFITSFFHITELIECIQEASRKKPHSRGQGLLCLEMWQEAGRYLKDDLTLMMLFRNKKIKANDRDETRLHSPCTERLWSSDNRLLSHLAWSGDSQLQQWRLLELSMEVSKPKFATPVVPLILLEHLQ